MERQDTNGAVAEKPTLARTRKKKPSNRQEPSMQVDIKRKSNMSQEEKDLATHVEICAIRYTAIGEKMDGLEQRITKVENSVAALKADIQQGFNTIALKIEKDSNKRTIQLIATAGSIIVAIVGALGVWLSHH